VDVDKGGYHISPQNVLNAITDKTKAVIAVDIAGVPCDYDALTIALGQKKGLFRANNGVQSCFGRPVLIADAAHSLGAMYKNKPSGSVADFTCFSFHAVKNLTTAEGGAVTWRPVQGIWTSMYINSLCFLPCTGKAGTRLKKRRTAVGLTISACSATNTT